MKFVKLNNQNREKICPLLHTSPYRTSDFSCGALLMFADYFNNEFCVVDEELFMRSSKNGFYSYSVPVGKMPLGEALNRLYDFAMREHGYLKMLTVPEPALEVICAKFDCKHVLQRDWCDYLYLSTDIIELSGKRFHGKRNHVSRFLRDYGKDCFHPIDESNRQRVVAFLDAFEKVGAASELAAYENSKTSQLLLEVDCDSMTGGFLEVEGKIVAATIGERIEDTLYVHVEKADRAYSGAYETIANEYAKYAAGSDVAYINREEDVGDEGLRRAKMSWNPFMILNKYQVEILSKAKDN